MGMAGAKLGSLGKGPGAAQPVNKATNATEEMSKVFMMVRL
jgi:hypothetical protein